MLMADVPLLPVQLVPDADAILGTRRRTAVVVGASVHAADSAQMAQAQQQTAAAQQQAAAAQQQAVAAKQETAVAQQQAAAAKQQAAAAPPAAPPAAAGTALPLGTVVSALPAGCVATPVGAPPATWVPSIAKKRDTVSPTMEKHSVAGCLSASRAPMSRRSMTSVPVRPPRKPQPKPFKRLSEVV